MELNIYIKTIRFLEATLTYDNSCYVARFSVIVLKVAGPCVIYICYYYILGEATDGSGRVRTCPEAPVGSAGAQFTHVFTCLFEAHV